MKKHIVLAGVLMVSAITFGQKKEIKKAEKAVNSENYSEAMSLLSEAEGMLSSAEADLKVQYYLVKASALMKSAGSDFNKLKMASESLNTAKEINGKTNSDIDDSLQELKRIIEVKAGEDYEAKRYAMAANKFREAYNLNTKDTLFLYNAAVVSKMADDKEKAIEYYKMVSDLGYTGIEKEFIAKNKETGEVDVYGSKNQRDIMVKSGTHDSPSERIAESKKETIELSLAQLYIETEQYDKALAIINEVRKNNPKDLNLLQVEADMVYRTGDIARFNELMKESIALDPTNPDVYNNLGVASSKLGLKDDAIKYYEKAIELDPNNSGAQLNIAVLILSDEGALNEEMNSLGTSNADYKKYDELKEQKNNLYRRALPYLESTNKFDPENIEVVRTLMGIYGQLGQNDKFKEMKALLAEMEGGQ